METLKKWNHNLAYACNMAENSTESSTGQTTETTYVSPMEKYYTYLAEQSNKREGNLQETDGYHCEICKNKGYIVETVYVDDLGYWTNLDRECECMAVRRNIARLNRSGLKSVIEKYRFDTYRTDEPWQQKVKEMAQDFVQNYAGTGSWFFVGGNTGAGKSHICTAICRELILSGKEVRYIRWRDESVKLKALVNDHAEYEKLMRELEKADVLYIDDFFKCGQNENGIQKPTDADIRLAFQILDNRYNNPDAITILSSESTLDEIFRMDGAIGGRIGERAGNYIISLTGDKKNYRKKMIG